MSHVYGAKLGQWLPGHLHREMRPPNNGWVAVCGGECVLSAAEQLTARKGEKTRTCQAGLMRGVREKGESTTKLLSFVSG